MKLENIMNVIENIAPKKLKEDFDNVGLMVGDKEKNINKILLALDCTMDVIEEAKKIGAELILTHHPLIFRKPSSITTDTLLGKKVIELIKNDINLYSAHTNWDSAKEGLNDTIVKMLGLESSRIISKCKSNEEAGIGRIAVLPQEKTLKEIIEQVRVSLGVTNLRYAGNLEQKIKTISIVNGSGQSFFEDSIRLGADLVITGDTTYHFVSDYEEMGLSIIDVGHFNSEWPVLVKLSENLQQEINSHEDKVEIFISKVSKDPYKFI